MDLSLSLEAAMNYGKQIRLFLIDGSASGIRYAELMNWTGQAFSCPKGLFNRLQDWPESQRAGVYVLIGLNADGADVAYIGESENVLKRLLAHVSTSTLDEIVEAFFFTSKDDNLTKGHTTYLEKHLITRAKEARRYNIKCDREPSDKVLSKPEAATMEDYLDNLYLVAAALGYTLFVTSTSAPAPEADTDLFSIELRESGIIAIGYPTELGFVVKKDSGAVASDRDSLSLGYKALKEELKQQAVLVRDGAKLRFTQDHVFRRSSAAAAVVSGTARSGPQSWRRQDGTSLKEVEAERGRRDERMMEAAIASHPGEDHAQPAI